MTTRGTCGWKPSIRYLCVHQHSTVVCPMSDPSFSSLTGCALVLVVLLLLLLLLLLPPPPPPPCCCSLLAASAAADAAAFADVAASPDADATAAAVLLCYIAACRTRSS